MMKKAFLIQLVICGVMLGGCATSPVRPGSAKLIAPDRLYIQHSSTANHGTAVVVRDAGFMGGGCRVMISLDGKKAAFIGAGEKATFPVAVGSHMLSMEPSHKGLCAIGAKSAHRSLTFKMKPDMTVTFRVGLSGSGDPVFYQSSL